jgi:hypothetical protein
MLRKGLSAGEHVVDCKSDLLLAERPERVTLAKGFYDCVDLVQQICVELDGVENAYKRIWGRH